MKAALIHEHDILCLVCPELAVNRRKLFWQRLRNHHSKQVFLRLLYSWNATYRSSWLSRKWVLNSRKRRRKKAGEQIFDWQFSENWTENRCAGERTDETMRLFVWLTGKSALSWLLFLFFLFETQFPHALKQDWCFDFIRAVKHNRPLKWKNKQEIFTRSHSHDDSCLLSSSCLLLLANTSHPNVWLKFETRFRF